MKTAPSPFKKNTDEFISSWDKLSPKLQKEIRAKIASGQSASVAVDIVFKKYNVKGNLAKWISSGCVKAAKSGGITFSNNLTARYYFLNKTFGERTISLSEKVTKLKLQDDVISTIQANLASQGRFNTLVTKISEYTTEETLPKGLLELERQARRVMSGDKTAYAEFTKTINREKSIALSAIHDGDETVLKRSYLRLVKSAEKLNEKGFNKALDNAINQKARSGAFRIAHTEMANAYGLAVKTDAKSDSNCTGIMWTSSSAENVCEACDALDGKIYAVDELPEYPLHPNCIIPGMRVSWNGKLLCAYKSLYSGNIIEVITKKRNILRVTSNHPVLTSNGWVIAKELTKGQQVISGKRSNWPGFSINPYNNKRPPLIQDVFTSIKKSGKMLSATVPVSAKDFHGDGRFINGDVDIVTTNGLLLNDVKSILNKVFCKNIFYIRNSLFFFLSCFSPDKFFTPRNYPSPYSIMGSLRAFLTSFWGMIKFNKQDRSFLTASSLDASFYKPSCDNISANPIDVRKELLRLSREVSFDEIVSVRTFNYSGHVYDLQVEPEQIYICNGVVVKNCGCILDKYYGDESNLEDKPDNADDATIPDDIVDD